MEIDRLIKEYFLEENIYITNKYFKKNRKKDESDLIEQVKLIAEFQKVLLKFKQRFKVKVPSIMGSEVEQLKNGYAILNAYNEERYRDVIIAFKKAIDKIEEIEYYSLLKRARGRKEISVGRIDERNLRVSDEIELGKIKFVTHNLIESDIVEYLNRERFNFKEEEIEKGIKIYIEMLQLNNISFEYIKIMTFAPIKVARYLSKNRGKINQNKLDKILREEKFSIEG